MDSTIVPIPNMNMTLNFSPVMILCLEHCTKTHEYFSETA